MHLAASEGHHEIVKYLLEMGYFSNAENLDRFGNSPFEDAVSNQNLQVARFIKDYYKMRTPTGYTEKTGENSVPVSDR